MKNKAIIWIIIWIMDHIGRVRNLMGIRKGRWIRRISCLRNIWRGKFWRIIPYLWSMSCIRIGWIRRILIKLLIAAITNNPPNNLSYNCNRLNKNNKSCNHLNNKSCNHVNSKSCNHVNNKIYNPKNHICSNNANHICNNHKNN